jgi:hypothetical protein
MELLISNAIGKLRRATVNGRDYLVAPITSIVPGVLKGSKGPLYYPPEEFAANVGSWDGMPLTVWHPTDPLTNEFVSASAPGVWENQGIGRVRNSRFNGKLRHEGWFDEELTLAADKRFGTDIWNRLTSGRPIELSTGLFTDNEEAPPGAKHNGRPYVEVVRNYRPDHIAVLPDQVGACSIKDGCGVMVNSIGKDTLKPGWGFERVPVGHDQTRFRLVCNQPDCPT